MKNRKAIFTISLDFELHWGRLDKISLEGNEHLYHQTRKVIPKMLQLFERYQVEVTWATVGMLFAENWEEWRSYCPKDLPTYQKPNLSSYHWGTQQTGSDPNCLFAPDLIREIVDCPGQEMASHTFSHYYTLENGNTLDQFREDLIAAKTIAKEKFGLSLDSLVFPRNQYNEDYCKIASKKGFSAVRTNPSDWFWKDPSKARLWDRLFRAGDNYLPLGKRTSYSLDQLPKKENGLFKLPASRFFRVGANSPYLDALGINRIKKEMSKAAREGEVYHLWWHPHNFGNQPEVCLKQLENNLQHFETLREKYQMESRNMRGVKEMIL